MKAPCVLLIDDEVLFINNIAALLQLKGYEVETAGNGKEGLECLQNNTFDIVVLDLIMPGISGMDVLKKIKKNGHSSSEVIILTGHASVDSGLEGLREGAFDYLTKPIRIKDLQDKIFEAVQRRRLRE